jgi:flavin reductase (DIM6/NTAB) family NADH-FMN oxidoreductase RutF/DNA-binding IclR family transcriptional regulator
MPEPSDPKWFRRVLGQYPTGVCVVTALEADGFPLALVVGSFTSVSLDPPLVAFLPDRKSITWPRIEATGRFCVNILSADQEGVCRQFAGKVPDKFSDITHRPAGTGSPIVEGVVAWIDCEIQAVHEAGDHFIVLGAVRDLNIERAGLPLLFFHGGYGRFTPLSLAALDVPGALSNQMRAVDEAREEMDRLSAETSCGCTASMRAGDELVIAASAGAPEGNSIPIFVGQRVPFMPPAGSVFVAWGSESEIRQWIGTAVSPEVEAGYRAVLAVVRARGCSLGLLSQAQRATLGELARVNWRARLAPPDELRALMRELVYDPPEIDAEREKNIRFITAPVFDAAGQVTLALTLSYTPGPGTGLSNAVACVKEAAGRISERLGGVALR